jgi:hypothetical protein
MPLGRRWRDAVASEALKLQWPVPDDALNIVLCDEKEDYGSPQRRLLGGCQRRRLVAPPGLVPVQDTSQIGDSLLFLSDRWMAAFRS